MPLYSLYGHLSELLVSRRQRVRAGEACWASWARLGLRWDLICIWSSERVGRTTPPPAIRRYSSRPLEGRGLIVGRVSDPAGRAIHGVQVGLYALGSDGGQTWLRQTTTYPAERIKSVASLGENFVFSDLEPGRYVVAAEAGGGRLDAEVGIRAGMATGIVIKR